MLIAKPKEYVEIQFTYKSGYEYIDPTGDIIVYFNGTTDYVEGYVYYSASRNISGNLSGTAYTRFWGYRLIGL